MYPPFCEMINITSSSDNEKMAYDHLRKFRNELISKVKELDNLSFIRIYNVTKSPMHKINGKYRYRFLIKTNYNRRLYNLINEILVKNYKKDISIIVDVNAINMY